MKARPRRRSAAEWCALIQEWKKSGKSREDFARARGLVTRTFVWWASELERRARNAGPDAPRAVAASFLPVRVVAEPRAMKVAIESASVSASSVEVVLGGGRMLRVPVGVEAAWLARVVAALEESTLDSAWRWGTELLVPVADVVRGEILIDDYVRADSTPLTILDAKHPSGRFKGQVWTFVAGGHVAFEFTKSWSADEIADSFLLLPNGYKQVDDYKGYASQVVRNGVKLPLVRDDRRLGCGMHIRRRFVEAYEARDLRAAVPLEHLRRIYQIEAEAKTNNLTDDARLALRRERSQPILSELRQWLDKQSGAYPPKSLLGGAVGYAHQQWTYFERCFTRGDFEIDNGAPEREIRTIAIGRRNFLFSGSVDAAKRLCAAYTLVVGAKRAGVDPFVYVKDILDKLARGWKINRVAELTPRRWAAAQAAQ